MYIEIIFWFLIGMYVICGITYAIGTHERMGWPTNFATVFTFMFVTVVWLPHLTFTLGRYYLDQ